MWTFCFECFCRAEKIHLIKSQKRTKKNPEQGRKKNAHRTTGEGEPLSKKAKPAIEETVSTGTSEEVHVDAKPLEPIEKADEKQKDQQSRFFRLLRKDEDPVRLGI
ncbi:hypothetical protein DPMN_089155 [Dreissena polymorpha]|uniref:Uncharacterized protein n=1 Tax=Dreissena polymorpha TaxID=45954 RepID=A0A9D4KW88_DREPO|nr:hypothetical protein DPMN_089155 [Dreissena polymorpha]